MKTSPLSPNPNGSRKPSPRFEPMPELVELLISLPRKQRKLVAEQVDYIAHQDSAVVAAMSLLAIEHDYIQHMSRERQALINPLLNDLHEHIYQLFLYVIDIGRYDDLERCVKDQVEWAHRNDVE
jgi:hypothetical protein